MAYTKQFGKRRITDKHLKGAGHVYKTKKGAIAIRTLESAKYDPGKKKMVVKQKYRYFPMNDTNIEKVRNSGLVNIGFIKSNKAPWN